MSCTRRICKRLLACCYQIATRENALWALDQASTSVVTITTGTPLPIYNVSFFQRVFARRHPCRDVAQDNNLPLHMGVARDIL